MGARERAHDERQVLMRIHLMTFRYSATLGGFDSEPLRDFLRDKEVIAFREHFFCVNEVPHLTCVVTYQMAIVPQAALDAARESAAAQAASPSAPRYESRNEAWAGRGGRRDGRPDPRAGLDERERALYDALAQWRGALAHKEGVPPFLLFTNKQLGVIAKRLPDSLTALGNIEGVGKSKLERYGAAVLRILHGAAQMSAEANAQVASSASSHPRGVSQSPTEGADALTRRANSGDASQPGAGARAADGGALDGVLESKGVAAIDASASGAADATADALAAHLEAVSA